MIYYLDGRFLPASRATIPVEDRGLLLSHGAFETLRVYQGIPFDADAHYFRLSGTLKLLGIKSPFRRPAFKKLLEAVARRNAPALVLRVTVTGGQYTGGLRSAPHVRPRVLVMARTPPLENGPLTLLISTVTKIPASALPPAAKTLNYLNSLLAFRQAEEGGYGEALQLDGKGYLAECAGSSLFFVKKGVLMTPSLDVGILPGVTRARVLALARDRGLRVREGWFKVADLTRADEVFVTNSAREIVAVNRVGKAKKNLTAPGPLTRLLQAAYQKAVENYVKRAARRPESRSRAIPES